MRNRLSNMSNGRKARIQVKRSLFCEKCHGLARGYLLELAARFQLEI